MSNLGDDKQGRGAHMGWRNNRWVKWLYWPDWRMEAKMFAVFVLLLVIPIWIVTQLAGRSYSKSIEENTVSYTSQIADKMMGKLDDYMEDMKKISIIPSYLETIQTGLRNSNDFYGEQSAIPTTPPPDSHGAGEPVSPGGPGSTTDRGNAVLPETERRRLDIQSQIANSIYFITGLKTGTNTVYLFDLYGNPYYVMKSSTVRSDLPKVYDEWRELAEKANGAPVLSSTQEVSDTINRKRFVFTVVRQIIDTTFSPVGLIAIDANISVIEDIVKDLDRTTEGTTLILDGENRVVYDSQKQYLSQSLGEREAWVKAAGTEGSFHTTVNGQKELIIYRQSAQTGWRIFISIPQKELMANADKTRDNTLFAGIFFISLAMLTSIVLIYALIRPLRSLVRTMKEVQNGNLNVIFPVKRRDEAGLVGTAFNRMIQRISRLIEEIHFIEQRKKQVELESLQHQINPHFIYNTLESIRMTAVLHDDSEVADMSRLLGKLLRYSIHQGMETVPVTEEWEYLDMYVQLLNFRYGNRFRLILPEEDLSRKRVIKLLFQPIVENAIHHGQDSMNTQMDIVIDYREEETERVFTVSDNGVGIEAEVLERLRSSLQASGWQERNGKGIGMWNVHERIKLKYGMAYGLSIDSVYGEGTVVTIRLPLEDE
ncbi:sensor histidine kinase [Gorillibacterium sp. CAU 1737]|uniref:sensor histidine kinase n=1 Tax=Gorillibacterium sp. CAU 1737 TaxID=3140362 RepID=UPI0032610BB6